MRTVPAVNVERALIELATVLGDYNESDYRVREFEPAVAAIAIEAMISANIDAKNLSKRLKLPREDVARHVDGLNNSVNDLRDDYCVELRDGEGPALTRQEFADALEAVASMLRKYSDNQNEIAPATRKLARAI